MLFRVAIFFQTTSFVPLTNVLGIYRRSIHPLIRIVVLCFRYKFVRHCINMSCFMFVTVLSLTYQRQDVQVSILNSVRQYYHINTYVSGYYFTFTVCLTVFHNILFIEHRLHNFSILLKMLLEMHFITVNLTRLFLVHQL